jgi:hypothetical protein
MTSGASMQVRKDLRLDPRTRMALELAATIFAALCFSYLILYARW